ncbi:lysophospholipase 1 precursor [Myxozyma melibiosi]|uniref:Lysophospholipase n=1 Tax=Myxozyma melibiosi TaxID=54550 RepID=A0ABR1F4I7_9ASCO
MRLSPVLLLASLLSSAYAESKAVPEADEADFASDLALAEAALAVRTVPKYFDERRLEKRTNPGGTYAPTYVSCPKDSSGDLKTLVREASSISNKENAYLDGRHAAINEYLPTYLNQLNMTDFDAETFLEDTNITIGIAFSGGGYRAMLSGAGFLAAFDNRTTNSTNDGHVGGLLQSATYIAGLSGGSWLVGSWAINGFPTIADLQGDEDVWDLSHSIINPDGWELWDTAEYWDYLLDAADAKRDAGFNISLTDYWGLGLANQLLNYTDGGPAVTFSDIRNQTLFKNFSMPYPLVVSDGRPYNTLIVSTNSSVYEFSPYEFGSWDPSAYAFIQTEYLGSTVDAGVPVNSSACVKGFDNAGFVIGTSATLFNQFILQLNSSGVSGLVYDAAVDILSDIGEDNDDVAPYQPNPFYGYNEDISYMYNETILNLVDGGEDYQNIPLVPLIQPSRGVDVIFAVDNSADTDYDWPSGWSLTATYDRQFGTQANGTKFPAVPDKNTFVGLNLTAQPTWFGCNASNITGTNGGTTVPLIVYLANHPLSYYSNTSTFKLSYETDEVEGMITNGYNVATQGNGTLDDTWAACIGCAIIHREVERRNATHTEQCQACLSKYCWDGTVLSSNATEETEEPDVEITSDNTGGAGMLSWKSAQWGVVALAIAVAAAL